MWRAVNGLAAAMMLWPLAAGASSTSGDAAMDAALTESAQALKRLFLTDGSYQTATEWKKEGDRVRYFSAERGEWEEIPVALVDWKATEEWNGVRARSQEEEMKQVTEEQLVARKEEQLNTPLVAPELRLPAEGGVFLLEELAGKPVLREVAENKLPENDHEGKKILMRPVAPVASRKQTIELKGAAAKVRVHSAAPTIFVDVDNERGAIPGEEFRIVRLEKKKDLRVLATNKLKISGERSQAEKFLQLRAEKFSGDWWKLIPLEDLTPGEYAIVIPAPRDENNAVVWDFGVDK
jgi:hypothetical protein